MNLPHSPKDNSATYVNYVSYSSSAAPTVVPSSSTTHFFYRLQLSDPLPNLDGWMKR